VHAAPPGAAAEANDVISFWPSLGQEARRLWRNMAADEVHTAVCLADKGRGHVHGLGPAPGFTSRSEDDVVRRTSATPSRATAWPISGSSATKLVGRRKHDDVGVRSTTSRWLSHAELATK